MSAKRSAEPSTPQTDAKRRNNQSPATPTPTLSMLATDHPTYKLNASYLAELDVAWQRVLAHPVFQGLPTMQTPPIGIQGFDVTAFSAAMSEHGQYTCGGNLFWADLFYTGTPGVPINRRGALSQISSYLPIIHVRHWLASGSHFSWHVSWHQHC